MKTEETQVKVLTLQSEPGKFLTNYPTADIRDAVISTIVYVREDLSGPWREIDEKEKVGIEKLKEIVQKEDEEKARLEEQENN